MKVARCEVRSWGDVKIDPNQPEGTRCIVKKLCEKMGLEVVP